MNVNHTLSMLGILTSYLDVNCFKCPITALTSRMMHKQHNFFNHLGLPVVSDLIHTYIPMYTFTYVPANTNA